jgi:hypothetical protein
MHTSTQVGDHMIQTSEIYLDTIYIRNANEGVVLFCTLYTKIQVHIITPTTLYHICTVSSRGYLYYTY